VNSWGPCPPRSHVAVRDPTAVTWPWPGSRSWWGALGLGIVWGIRARSAADTTLRQATAEAAISVVNVVSPQRGAPTQEILLPGTTQAFTDAPIFARTSGYVKRWFFDIGAHVKQGQLLAEIESPEVDQQLQQAQADLETAQANLRQAQITADRWVALLQSDSVSKQETDQAGERAERNEGHRRFERRERPPARAAQGVREGRGTVRGCHHRTHSRHRGPDQCRCEHRGSGALSHGSHPHAPRVRRGPRGLLASGLAPGAPRRSPSRSSLGGRSTARS